MKITDANGSVLNWLQAKGRGWRGALGSRLWLGCDEEEEEGRTACVPPDVNCLRDGLLPTDLRLAVLYLRGEKLSLGAPSLGES